MPTNAEPKFPNRRAYVVKLRQEAEPGALSGRVENLLTCDQHEFSSASELVAFIEADLRAGGAGRTHA